MGRSSSVCNVRNMCNVREASVQVGGQLCRGSRGGRGERTHDQDSAGRQGGEPVADQGAQAAGHGVADHGTSHGLADDEPSPRDVSRGFHLKVDDQLRTGAASSAAHCRAEVSATSHAVPAGQHDLSDRGRSGGELRAALAATRGEDGAARTGPHPQPKTVRLGPAPVVRLEGALAHEDAPRGKMGRRRLDWSRPPRTPAARRRSRARDNRRYLGSP